MLSTIGYEGARPDDFIGTLRLVGVQMVVDIRDRAQSRRPGFSKSALRDSLEAQGIGYIHLRELGDPKEGRDAARSGDFAKFRRTYAAVLQTDQASEALEQIAALARQMSVCLLCYERDHHECHRKIVADYLESVVEYKVRHLGVRSDVSLGKLAGQLRDLGEGAPA
ncbi:DUF488 domain-containing protein [Brevundimonas sp.]|uniref:DUF488 domain-containing protein n=1 Tax=Brevundimonas sp. TaxID=1871086 RepID=UPI002D2B5D1E|nr:DUF488 domain-containing protein [Brevundimonas sp.]HYC99127.1 DUF488 domain-containing protein [Brevundimonas sp.]